MTALLDDLIGRLNALPAKVKEQVVKDAKEATKGLLVVPNTGPQTAAYLSEADVLLFGGSPGGGKTVLELALGINDSHYRTLIVRKSFTDLEGLIDTAKKLVGSDDRFVGGMRPKYRKPNGGVIHFAGVAGDGGIGGHQGVDHDLICIDEAAQIPEKQVRLLLGWLRTDRPGQRCRAVLGSNPPLDSTGDWMIDYFSPWLNPTHPNPAMPGELRYFLPTDGGKDRECEKGDSTTIGGVTVYAQSRTFIPSKFTDNPYYSPEEYAKTLGALPAEVREILVTGNFMLARKDQEFQTIPTAWVKAAQERWTDKPPRNVPMCAMGVDASGGGDDPLIIAPRYDGWYPMPIKVEGKDIPMERIGAHCAGVVVSHRLHDAKVIVDMGGGYGGPLYEQLVANIGSEHVAGYKGAEASVRRTKDQKLGFWNKRSQAIWQFREALDPSQEGGSPIALPPDPELVADLTASTFEVTPRGIKVESKEDVCERLGRSTDKGDAAVMAWYDGARAMTHAQIWTKEMGRAGRTPTVNYGPRRPNGLRRH
jgi:hypothetical protein